MVEAKSSELEGIQEVEEPEYPACGDKRPNRDFERVQIVFVCIDGVGDYSYT